MSRAVSLLVICLWLSACGGGGGGGATPPPSTPPPPPAAVPQNPPALPGIPYTGSRAPAGLDDGTAGALADILWVSLPLTQDMAGLLLQFPFLPGDTIDETIAGEAGGTLQVTGRSYDLDSGWIAFEYDDFHSEGAIQDGMLVFELFQGFDTNQDELTRVAFHDFDLSIGAQSVNYAGHLSLRRFSNHDGEEATGSVRLRLNHEGHELWLQDWRLRRSATPIGDGIEIEATGRIYESRLGWIELSFEAPWAFRHDGEFPHHGGAMLGTSGADRVLRVASLTPELVSLEYTTSGSRPDRSARVTWPESFELQTRRMPEGAPVADAGAGREVLPGTSVTLNSGYSSHPETVFLEHRWGLRFRPPGSRAVLDREDLVTPRLQPDVPGRYLLALEVDDGRRVDDDFVVITVREDANPELPAVALQLAPDALAEVGEVIQIDKTRYTPVSFADFRFEVEGHATLGESLEISQDATSASFVASQPGIYQISTKTGPQVGRDQQSFAVGVPSRHLPPVWFPVSPGLHNLLLDIDVADLNGDGRSEIITTSSVSVADPGIISIFSIDEAATGGMSLSAGAGSTTSVGDINGDGLPDIVAAATPGIDVLIQNGDGTFQAPLRVPSTVFNGHHDRSVAIGDINGDGRYDIVTPGGFVGTIDYYLQQPDGRLASAALIDLAVSERLGLATGDVNGDGIDDIVVSMTRPQPKNIAVLHGQRDAEPAEPVYLPQESNDRDTPALAIGDLTGDSRDDLVFTERPFSVWVAPKIHIYFQTEAGELVLAKTLEADDRVFGVLLDDYDRDGRQDILRRDSRIGLGVHYQQPDGSFGAVARDLRSPDGDHSMQPYAVGDVDGDGMIDVIFRDAVDRFQVAGILFARDSPWPGDDESVQSALESRPGNLPDPGRARIAESYRASRTLSVR